MSDLTPAIEVGIQAVWHPAAPHGVWPQDVKAILEAILGDSSQASAALIEALIERGWLRVHEPQRPFNPNNFATFRISDELLGRKEKGAGTRPHQDKQLSSETYLNAAGAEKEDK